MRIIEIILKLAFLGLAITVMVSQHVFGHLITALAIVGFVLGLFLIFNKKESYGYPKNYPKMNRVYLMRRIEGVILVLAAIVVFLHS
jgi:hypothetical protein